MSIFAVKTKLMFFQPRIGLHYHEGFKGYRTLVLGVKHHCTHKRCPHYDDCVTHRNCASYNEVCPVYGDRHDLRLSQSNQIEIDAFLEVHDRYPTYSYFTKLMLGKTDDCTEVEKTAFWEQVAFANYLQYFCPSPQVPEYKEDGLDYRAEDWRAFQELLEAVQPEVLLVWNVALKTLLDKKIVEGEIKVLTHFDDFRSETLTINRYLYKVQPKKTPNESFADFRRAFCLEWDEAAAARLMLNALQKARFRHFVPHMELSAEMAEVARPNIWDEALMRHLIGKVQAAAGVNDIVTAFESEIMESVSSHRCASSVPLGFVATKAFDADGHCAELSWFDLGKTVSIDDVDTVLLFLDQANDIFRNRLKALIDKKLKQILVLVRIEDAGKLLPDVAGSPCLASITEKEQGLLLRFESDAGERVALEHGGKRLHLRRGNLVRGMSLQPFDYLSQRMSRSELNDLVYSVFHEQNIAIPTTRGERDLVELLEGLLARNYICWQGKRLKAVRGKAGQLLHRGLYEAGLSWTELEGLFADDNMAKNANRKKIAKLLENPSAAARYYRELFGL